MRVWCGEVIGARSEQASIGARGVLPMNGVQVEICSIPPIRQRQGEWMGHGELCGDWQWVY